MAVKKSRLIFTLYKRDNIMKITVNTKTSLRDDNTYNYEEVTYTFYQAGRDRDWFCSYLSPKTGYTVVREYKSEKAAQAAQARMIKQGGQVSE